MTKAQEMLELADRIDQRRDIVIWGFPPATARNDMDLIVSALRRTAQADAPDGQPQSPNNAISACDPLVIIAGIRQFGLASDGSDLRDLETAISSLTRPDRKSDNG